MRRPPPPPPSPPPANLSFPLCPSLLRVVALAVQGGPWFLLASCSGPARIPRHLLPLFSPRGLIPRLGLGKVLKSGPHGVVQSSGQLSGPFSWRWAASARPALNKALSGEGGSRPRACDEWGWQSSPSSLQTQCFLLILALSFPWVPATPTLNRTHTREPLSAFSAEVESMFSRRTTSGC